MKLCWRKAWAWKIQVDAVTARAKVYAAAARHQNCRQPAHSTAVTARHRVEQGVSTAPINFITTKKITPACTLSELWGRTQPLPCPCPRPGTDTIYPHTSNTPARPFTTCVAYL